MRGRRLLKLAKVAGVDGAEDMTLEELQSYVVTSWPKPARQCVTCPWCVARSILPIDPDASLDGAGDAGEHAASVAAAKQTAAGLWSDNMDEEGAAAMNGMTPSEMMELADLMGMSEEKLAADPQCVATLTVTYLIGRVAMLTIVVVVLAPNCHIRRAQRMAQLFGVSAADFPDAPLEVLREFGLDKNQDGDSEK